MKKILFLVLFLVTSSFAISWSQISAAIDNSPVLPSAKHEVSAYGYNFRQYTWIDPAGRVCTTAMYDGKGLGLACEFPPNQEMLLEIQKKLKK